MEQRPPRHPRLAWEEKTRPASAHSSGLKPNKLRKVQTVQADLCRSTWAVPEEEENDLDIIRAFLSSRPKKARKAQKLRFLGSICTICSFTHVNSMRDLLHVGQLEVVETIEALLQEEPTERLGTRVRQQAMLAIASMSRAGLLLQEKSSLLHTCFSSVFYRPPWKKTKGTESSLYSKTLAAMDSMLQVLLCSADTQGIVVLQNIFQLLLPFTNSQTAVVRERALARIARLANFITIYPQLQVCCCFAQATVQRHQCSKTQRFSMLGVLVGHLTLCCTSKDKRTCQEAAEALYHLHTFILQQRSKWPCRHDTEQLQPQEGWQATQHWQLSQTIDASKLFLMFTKYLEPSNRADIILMAIKNMRASSIYSISMAAHMVDVLLTDPDFQPAQMLNIVWAIYRNLPSIRAEVAFKSLNRALLVLTAKHCSVVVASLLQCSPTCSRDAMAMWRVMLSKHQAAEEVLQELLSLMINQSRRKTSTSTKDNLHVLALAATRTISKILLQAICLQEVEAIFPQLFLALLFQVSFTAELTLEEVQTFWREGQQEQRHTPIRLVVQSLKVLLCRMGFQSQVEAIEVQGGWDTLLRAYTSLTGVRIMAREMMKIPRSLRSVIFCDLAELLSVKDSTWKMVAMVFLVEMLGCTDFDEELDRVLEIFPMYLRSQCPGMPSLVLGGIRTLLERPDAARTTLFLLPYIMVQLQGADSDATAAALPILGNMLQLLEGQMPSLTALELAGKLRPLFTNESDVVREQSIRLFQSAMELVVGAEKKMMKEEVWDSLLPLLFHLHDQDRSVAKAAQEALCSAGRFLKWGELVHLVETAQPWRISECLLAKKRSRAKDYLHQSQPYLKSPQETLRREAIRFIGLIGRQVGAREKEHIREVLQGALGDASPVVSSLVTQTVLILELGRPRWGFKLRILNLELLREGRRWHSDPSRDSAQAGTAQQPQP